MNKLRTKNHTKLIELLILGTAVLGCTGEFENDALVLEGDWPEQCTRTTRLDWDDRHFHGWACAAYERSLGDFILHAEVSRDQGGELVFWLEDQQGERQPSETAASSRVPRDGEMKQAAREQKQKLQQALAAKKDLDAGGSQIAYRSALAKDGKMMFSRPYTAIAIPSPWGTKRNDGSVYKHKLKLFRKSNQEWVDTQKAAHTDADGVREPHAHVKELNSEAHKLGQEAASLRYAASAMSTVGDAAVATSTLTGGADGFTASIGTVSKLAAAATLRSAEVKSSLAEQKTADTLDKVRDNYLGANGVTEALTAIKDGHHAAQKSATRRKRAAIIQSVVQSTGLVGDHVGIASGSEAVLDSKGSAVRGQGVEGHAWTFGKPTAFTAAETGLDAAQDGGVATATGAYRPAKNHVVGGGNKSTAKRLQQEAAVKEMAAYQTIKEKGHHSFSGSNPMNPAARRPQPQHRDP